MITSLYHKHDAIKIGYPKISNLKLAATGALLILSHIALKAQVAKDTTNILQSKDNHHQCNKDLFSTIDTYTNTNEDLSLHQEELEKHLKESKEYIVDMYNSYLGEKEGESPSVDQAMKGTIDELKSTILHITDNESILGSGDGLYKNDTIYIKKHTDLENGKFISFHELGHVGKLDEVFLNEIYASFPIETWKKNFVKNYNAFEKEKIALEEESLILKIRKLNEEINLAAEAFKQTAEKINRQTAEINEEIHALNSNQQDVLSDESKIIYTNKIKLLNIKIDSLDGEIITAHFNLEQDRKANIEKISYYQNTLLETMNYSPLSTSDIPEHHLENRTSKKELFAHILTAERYLHESGVTINSITPGDLQSLRFNKEYKDKEFLILIKDYEWTILDAIKKISTKHNHN